MGSLYSVYCVACGSTFHEVDVYDLKTSTFEEGALVGLAYHNHPTLSYNAAVLPKEQTRVRVPAVLQVAAANLS